jgi:hypothetical protein
MAPELLLGATLTLKPFSQVAAHDVGLLLHHAATLSSDSLEDRESPGKLS